MTPEAFVTFLSPVCWLLVDDWALIFVVIGVMGEKKIEISRKECRFEDET